MLIQYINSNHHNRQQMIISKAKSQSTSQGKIRGFNTKGYFCNVEPYCEQYLKAKHAIYEKSKKMREAKNQGKQNNPVMFQFNKPKSGFYQLKGCKVLKPVGESNKNNEKNRDGNKGKQYLEYFIKKYAQRKQRKEQHGISASLLPILKTNPLHSISSYPTHSLLHHQSNHNQSIGQQLCSLMENSRRNGKKLKTEPIHAEGNKNRKNKSCLALEKQQKILSYTEIFNCNKSINKVGMIQ